MAETRPIIIKPLLGLDQRWGAEAPSAAVAQDLWWDPRGGWQSAGGYKRIIRGPADQVNPGEYLNPFASVGAIESIHAFSQHSGARRWIAYVDGVGGLYTLNPSNAARGGAVGDAAKDREGNAITRTVIQTPWQRHQSACWGDRLYICNAIDRALVFNGYFWDYAGWQGPAGTVTASTMSNPHADDMGAAAIKIPNVGLGLTSDTGTEDYLYARRYRVTYINDRGAESPLSEASEVVFFENTGGTSVSDAAHFAQIILPIGPPETVARRIYATQSLYDSSNTLITGRDTRFYFHSTIPDNVSHTIMDSMPDGYLGAAVDPNDFGAWPVNARFIASFNGRMYAAGAGNSEVYYSKRGNPEVWPDNNVLDIGDAYLGPITALYATRNVLVVAKARGLYLIVDDGVNEPVARTLTRESGWVAQNTIREIPGVGIFGLSDDGVTMLKGTLQNEGIETTTLPAAVGLPKVFSRLNRSAVLNACAAVYHRDKEYWLAIPVVGNPNNCLVLVYHYEIREWTTRENYPISSILEDPTGALLFSSYADTTTVSPDGKVHLGIMVYSRGCQYKDDYADTPTAIEPIYETNEISVAASFRAFKPLYVLVEGILHGNNDLTVNVRPNQSQSLLLSTAATVDQQYPQEPSPVYGTAAFDAGEVWQEWRPGVMRFDIQTTTRQPILNCSVRITPSARYMTLMGLSLEVNPEGAVSKPLKSGA